MSATIAELAPKIEALNSAEQPYYIKLEGQKIIGTWNILDAKWLGLISANKANKDYRVTFTLDEASQTYSYEEVQTSSDGSVGTSGATGEKSFFKGKQYNMEMGLELGFGMKNKDEPTKVVGAATYDFNNQKVKQPIIDTLKAAGWSEKKGFFAKLLG